MRGVKKFFARYEEGANSFDPELVTSLYTSEFLGGSPHGVAAGRNDDKLRTAILDRQQFFAGIGFRKAKIRKIRKTTLDDHFALAKVSWRMRFEKNPPERIEVDFDTTYLLFDDGSGPRVAAWISHEDERQAMREAGLLAE